MPERIKKLNEVLKREIGSIILKEIDLPRSILVTVTKVETSRDLDQCKVFISVFPRVETKRILGILNKENYSFHQILNRKLFIRRVPRIKFFKEKELEKAQKIDKILDDLAP